MLGEIITGSGGQTEVSALRQLEAEGCRKAALLLEKNETQEGFALLPTLRRLSTLYNIPPAEIYFRRKADVEYEVGRCLSIALDGARIEDSLQAIQALCFVYYPLAEFKARIGYVKSAQLGVGADYPEVLHVAYEIVDSLVWERINLDFRDINEAAAKLSAFTAANLNHIHHTLAKRRRRISYLDREKEECFRYNKLDYLSQSDSGKRSESIRLIRQAASQMSYQRFNQIVAEMPPREQAAVLIWLGYFPQYPNIKEAVRGLGISADAYKIGLALAAKRLNKISPTDFPETEGCLPSMFDLAGQIKDKLSFSDGRLTRFGSPAERLIFYLLSHPAAELKGLTPVQQKVLALLKEQLEKGYVSFNEIILQLGYKNPKSVRKIIRRIMANL